VSDFTHTWGGGDSMSGVAWLDYDNDGDLDFYVANGVGSNDGLMSNNGDGTFANVSVAVGLADGNGSSGVVAADLNNDGHTDIIAAGEPGGILLPTTLPSERPVRVFANNGDGSFRDVTSGSGIAIAPGYGVAFHPVLGDIDNDGLLDLFITASGSFFFPPLPSNRLFHNTGDFTFEDISAGSGVDVDSGACPAAFSHYDRDGLIDLYIADCNVLLPASLRLMRNNGNLTFTEITAEVGLNTPQQVEPQLPFGRGYWMCLGLGDYDNDRDFDLFSTNVGSLIDIVPPVPDLDVSPFLNQRHGFFERKADGSFVSVENEVGISAATAPEFAWGCSMADFDNDGREDLVFAGNIFAFGLPEGSFDNPGHLFLNQGDKTFASGELPVDLSGDYTTGVTTADYNNDGFVDVLFSNGGYPELTTANAVPGSLVLLENKPNGNHWLTVRLRGTESNASGVGSIIQVRTRGRKITKEVRAGSSFLSQDSPWSTFGLGKRRLALVRVDWPSGLKEWFVVFHINRTVTLVEGEGVHF
jgi:hypothetical protein